MSNPPRHLYVFLDEAGNLDFSPTGSRFFVLGGITKERPFKAYVEMTELKYDLVERGTALEYFHASENAQAVRNQVFDIIERNLTGVSVDSIIVEKQKLDAPWRAEEHFYPKTLGNLLRAILAQYSLPDFQEVVVFTDSLPVHRKRSAIEKAIKTTLAAMLPSPTWICRSPIIAPGRFIGNGTVRTNGRLPAFDRRFAVNGMCYRRGIPFRTENKKMNPQKNDHPGYSYERTQWVLVTGVEPLNRFASPTQPTSISDTVRQASVEAEPHRLLIVLQLTTSKMSFIQATQKPSNTPAGLGFSAALPDFNLHRS